MSRGPVNLGWLDTNVFLHAITPGDPHGPRCRDLLKALEDGRADGWLAATVVHELSYVLSRRRAFPTRAAIAFYLSTVLSYPGARATDKALLLATVGRWAAGTMGFVDALLAELAARDGLPVCSVNARDFPATPNSYTTAVV